jgi:nitrogen fixation protein FixH
MNTTVWRWFPHAMIAALGLVIAVNFYMVYDAFSTFPGVAGRDGFDLSNEYKRVVATAQRQAALGWQVEADVTQERFPALRLTDRAGAPMTATEIRAQAERPVGPVDSTALIFRMVGDGLYRADTSLYSGQWDIMLSVQADGQLFNATRRVVVK